MSMKVGNKPPQPRPTVKPEVKKPEVKAPPTSPQRQRGGGQGYSDVDTFTAKPLNARALPDLGSNLPRNLVPRNTVAAGGSALSGTNVQTFSSTQPGQVATTTAPASTPEQARAQAEADVTLLAQRNHPLGVNPRDVEGLIAAHANDPEYIAQLMGVLHEQGGLATGVVAAFTADGTSPEGQQAILAAVRLGLERGTLPQSAIDEIAQHPPMAAFTNALQTAQAAGGDPATLLQSVASSTPELRAAAVEALTATAATAQANLSELNQQLSRELARYGPAMTPEQRQAFIDAFKARHPEYQTAQAAQEALGTYVQANLAQLKADALSNPEAASKLFGAMEALAGSSQNGVVVEALQDPQLATALRDAGGAEAFNAKVMEPAVGTLAAEGAMTAGADRTAQAGVAQQLNALYNSLSQVPGLADNVNGGLGAIRDTASALATYANGGTADALFGQLNHISEEAGNTSGIGKAMAGANFLLGASLIAEGVLSGNPQELMEGLVQTASNANAIGYGLELASKALPNIVSKGLAAGAVGLTEKVAGVVGVISNTISFLDQLGHLDNDSDRLKAASSFAAAAGGVMMLVPGLQIPGAVFTAVGAVLGVVGEWQAGREQEARNDAFDAEALEIMRGLQPPVDAHLLNTLSQLSPEEVSSMQATLNMTPQQWAQLATSSPGLFAAVNQNGPHLMEQLANVFGLHDFASAQQFMSQLAPPGTPPELVQQLFRDIASFSSDPREFREQFERLYMGQPENLQRPTPEPSATPSPTPTPGPSTPEPIEYLDVLQNMLDLLNGQP